MNTEYAPLAGCFFLVKPGLDPYVGKNQKPVQASGNAKQRRSKIRMWKAQGFRVFHSYGWKRGER